MSGSVPGRSRAVDVGVTLAAAAGALGASLAVAGLREAFVAAPVASTLTGLAPGAAMTFAITVLGDLGQPLAFAGALAVTLALLALAVAVGAFAGRRLYARTDVASRTTLAAAGGGVAAGALAFALTGAAVPSAVAGLAAGVVRSLGALGGGMTPTSTARRRVLRSAAGAAALLGVGGVLAARGGTTVTSAASGGDGGTDGEPADPTVEALLSAAAERTFTVEGLDPLVSEDHYVVDIASVDPDLLAGSWSLSITGAVDDVTTFDYETLLGMDAEHRFVTLRCVGEPLNGEKVDTALWTGVPATALLEEAGVDLDSECCVMLRAADDYYEEFPLAALEDALIAYRMNGGPLPQQHGRPVRALVPGHWGEINVKWLTEIEILEREQDGFWEKKGWHGTGPVNTVAKLHSVRTPGEGRVRLAGHAYAGTRGVSRVEVSTDGGESWTDAELTERLPGRVPADAGPDAVAEAGEAADAWRMWRHEYTADGPHDVVVRAVEADGTVQPSEEADAFPSGATGWVSERVRP